MAFMTRFLGSALACLLFTFSAQASFFDDLVDGDFDAIAGKVKIRAWNDANKEKFSIVDAKFGCGGFDGLGGDFEMWGTYDCRMTGSLVNNTNDYIKAVVVNISFYNKQAQSLVLEQQRVIYAKVVPTVSAEFEDLFDSDKLSLAYRQLGENYSWNFEIVGAVPNEMNPQWLLDDE